MNPPGAVNEAQPWFHKAHVHVSSRQVPSALHFFVISEQSPHRADGGTLEHWGSRSASINFGELCLAGALSSVGLCCWTGMALPGLWRLCSWNCWCSDVPGCWRHLLPRSLCFCITLCWFFKRKKSLHSHQGCCATPRQGNLYLQHPRTWLLSSFSREKAPLKYCLGRTVRAAGGFVQPHWRIEAIWRSLPNNAPAVVGK